MPEVVGAKPVTGRNLDHLFRRRTEMILHPSVSRIKLLTDNRIASP
jgi:hypothetical protein